MLGVTPDRPYLTFCEHEIVALYDAPHLLKRFRNMFMEYDLEWNTNLDIECDGKQIANIAKWSHIKQFLELDYQDPFFVFAPALTKNHINPSQKETLNVRLAAQVFSHSAAAGMNAKLAQGTLPPEALPTVNLINKMDQLFDSLNANSTTPIRGKKYLANISHRSPHFKYFQEMIPIIKNCKFIGNKIRPPSLDGWVQTMLGFERLWYNLKKKYPEIRSLSTRRLQCNKML